MAEQDIVERLRKPVEVKSAKGFFTETNLVVDPLHAEAADRLEALEAELKYESERGDEWFDAATYEVGGCPQLWSDRAKKAEAEVASLRQQLADALKVANRQPPADTTDKSQIEFLVSILRRGRHGADISNQAASLIEALTEANFEMRFGVIRALSHPDREGERE